MNENKLIYFIWDSSDIDRMVRILKSMGTSEDIIDQLVDLELRDGTAVIPYPNGYSTYYGYELPEDEYEEYKEELNENEGDESTEGLKSDENGKIVEVDIDDDMEDYKVTESIEDAVQSYSKVDPEYDDVLDTLRVLLHVRDEYRDAEADAIQVKIGEFKEGDYISPDFSILSSDDGFEVVETEYPSIFSFATKVMADKFLENFEEQLIEIVDNLGYLM